MGWICNNCGNQGRFTKTREYTEYGTEEIFIDGEDNELDYGDRDSNDSEYGDITETKCDECESDNVDWIDDEEEIETILQNVRDNAELTLRNIRRGGPSAPTRNTISWKTKIL